MDTENGHPGSAPVSNGLVRLVDLHKSFGRHHVLKGVSLGFSEGRTTVVLGPSGCGKSVMLKHLIGLLKPDAGEVWYGTDRVDTLPEKRLGPVRRHFGFLFQQSALFDSINVQRNVAFPLEEHTALSPRERRNRVEEVLELVGLGDALEKMPAELSGGQRKRVALARAIVLQPRVILYDEPTTGLDPIRADVINELIVKLQLDLAATSIVVTHDLTSAFRIADRIVMLYDGRVVTSGTPAEIRASEHPLVQWFMGGGADVAADVAALDELDAAESEGIRVKDGTANFLTGLACLTALAGLIGLMLLFGELDAVVRPRYVLTIDTDHASGLRVGSGVELNGVPIGIVDDVTVTGAEPFPVRVRALIDEDVAISRDAVPYAAASLLGGSAVLELDMASAGEMLPRDGTGSIAAPIRFRMIEQLTSELDARMAPLLNALERFDELSETYISLGRNLNELVVPQTEEALADGVPPNLRTVVARTCEMLDGADEALELARAWLGDEQLRADAHAAVEKASLLIERATGALDRFGALAGALEADADTVVARLVPVADEMSRTLEEIRRLTRLASDGPGTVGRLLNDPALYQSLADAARRLEQATRDAQLLIEKIKAEGFPVNF